MHSLYLNWSNITALNWFKEIINNLKGKKPKMAIFCVNFQRHISYMLVIIAYSYKTSVNHNVINTQWTRSPTDK